MGIRGRLLALALGIALPLTLVGLAALWGMWTVSRQQLDQSVSQQAELAAVALERWGEAQRQPLMTIASYVAEHPVIPATFQDNLRLIVSSRPQWMDLHILDAAGSTMIAQTSAPTTLSPELITRLFTEMRSRKSWAVVTDWGPNDGPPTLAIAAPIKGGGAVIVRMETARMRELFSEIAHSGQAIIMVFDPHARHGWSRISASTPLIASHRSHSGNLPDRQGSEGRPHCGLSHRRGRLSDKTV